MNEKLEMKNQAKVPVDIIQAHRYFFDHVS